VLGELGSLEGRFKRLFISSCSSAGVRMDVHRSFEINLNSLFVIWPRLAFVGLSFERPTQNFNDVSFAIDGREVSK